MSFYSAFKKSASRKDFSFYEKTAGAAMAVAAISGQAQGAIVYSGTISSTTTGSLVPGSSTGVEIGSQFGSVAYGYITGIGTIGLGSIGYHRSGGATVNSDAFDSDNTAAFYDSGYVNGSQAGNDNYYAFGFSDPTVNGGANVFGWVQIDISDTDAPGGFKIVGFAYEDSGAPIVLGAIPEPSGLALLALGAVGTTAFHRRRRDA